MKIEFQLTGEVMFWGGVIGLLVGVLIGHLTFNRAFPRRRK